MRKYRLRGYGEWRDRGATLLAALLCACSAATSSYSSSSLVSGLAALPLQSKFPHQGFGRLLHMENGSLGIVLCFQTMVTMLLEIV
jgi:hypothetical protein